MRFHYNSSLILPGLGLVYLLYLRSLKKLALFLHIIWNKKANNQFRSNTYNWLIKKKSLDRSSTDTFQMVVCNTEMVSHDLIAGCIFFYFYQSSISSWYFLVVSYQNTNNTNQVLLHLAFWIQPGSTKYDHHLIVDLKVNCGKSNQK